jgi:hypothetical protein
MIDLMALNGVVDFSPMHRHLLGRLDPKANLVAANLDNHDCNIVVDDDTLVLLTG